MRGSSPTTVGQGKVISRLVALQARAGEIWGVRVTQRMLSEMTGIRPTMIRSLCHSPRRQTIKSFNLAALGRLCWFFDCDIDQLLTYLPPGVGVSSLPATQGRRTQPPEPGHVPLQDQLVHTRLPDALGNEKVVSLMRATGKKRDTLVAFRLGIPKQIRYTTLVAICDAAYQQDHDPAQIRKVLAYTPKERVDA